MDLVLQIFYGSIANCGTLGSRDFMNNRYAGLGVGIGVGLGLGVCFGAAVGVATNVAAGVAVGVSLGVSFSLIFGAASIAESGGKKVAADKPLPHPLGLSQR